MSLVFLNESGAKSFSRSHPRNWWLDEVLLATAVIFGGVAFVSRWMTYYIVKFMMHKIDLTSQLDQRQ